MDNAAGTARVHLKITGRVQGVYYRASALQEAQRLGLTGWVRNCADGAVEVIAEGPRREIDQLIAWCQHGPAEARVTTVELRWETPERRFRGFSITR